VFAFGFDGFYSKPNKSESEDTFNTNKSLRSILSLSSDKKSGLIILSAEHIDRFFAKELVDIYLKELINKIKLQDMKEIDKQIEYYKKELNITYNVSLKEQLSKSLSALMQKRVFSLANDYYFVSKLTDSRVAYIKEKTKPKRALILIVSMVTSLILGIFMVFLIEFIKNSRNDEKN
jgi:LPS O-antigen subunit length determinant protein (WzzB/FepE family)